MSGAGPGLAAPVSVDEAARLLASYLSAAADRTTGVILAVSGGPDSVALMRLAARVHGRNPGPPVWVANVDHGLRPGSRTEAEAVAAWAGACGLPHAILTWAVSAPPTRLQEAAREARYGLLVAKARELGASHVLTAHTLDDQAETIVMRMARGTGIAGLGGMRREVERGGIVVARPFLSIRKERLVATCRLEGWPYFDDPFNADPRFARARLRGTLMPALAAEGLTAERLAALGARARRADEALSSRAASVTDSARLGEAMGRIELAGAPLLDEPEAVFLRIVARAIAAVAGPIAPPVRLDRFERRILEDLRPALLARMRRRLTIGGALVEASPDGRLIIAREARRRARGFNDA